MRLTLDPIALELLAEAPAGDGPREISGLAVPWEQEARIKDRRVTFAADSVAIEIGSPLLLGHDDNQPVGVLTSSTSSRDGLRAVFAIDRTPAGDAAIVQARSGSRRGLSVGVDLEADGFETDPRDPDRIRVLAGRAAETSLVAMAAYPTAGVEQIAAHKQEETVSETTPKPPEPDQPEPDDDDDDTQPAEPESRVEARRSRGLVIADRSEPEMRLGEYVQELVKAERGDRAARIRIEAALTRENVTTNPGVVPIAYVNQVIDSLGDARPLFDAMDHADMPASGMTIRRPEITTRPDGGWLADDTAGAPTSAVKIGNHDVNVLQWAWGGAASVALVERSSPSYVEEVFAQAIKAYHKDVEADIAAAFDAAVGPPAASLGVAVTMFLGAYRDYPNLVIAGGAAYGKLLDALGTLMFASGSADAQGNATLAGMRVIASPDVGSDDAWVTRSDFQEIRESSPIRLTVSDVESLSLEIGVTSFYARTPTRQALGGMPGAVQIPGFTPPLALSASSSSRERKS